jgi:hypothetical protein
MSKIVKSVGKAVSGVVKGVSKVVKGVVKGAGALVRKIASSKLGKVLLTAAAIYFGGAAIMGAIGGAGASTGFLGTISGAIQGAGAGISSAWSGLTGAVTGGGLGSLQSGFMGANAAGQAAVGGMQAVGTNLAAGAQASGAFTAPVTSGSVVGQPLASAAAGGAPLAPAAGTGFWGTNAGAATVMAGGQLAGGLIQGVGQQKALEEQRAYEDQQLREERARQEANMNVRFNWGEPGDGSYIPGQPQQVGGMNYGSPSMSGGPALVRSGGLISSRLNDPTQPYGYEFPIYNPAMSRFYG